ncbi:hypothetical protein DACRYDRAFT_22593 [Dacryopinax primogenitus]|uniref:Mid2 domain-containing protein n=1 Tax=Dacryopinax primogenitus (strain DJM 731) TaxID=1858805 RepID=M5FY49_DACPD|nr:uncharacterized protein DACRYDRAFT_22593 [Dacryopinax primogenitus]EJU01464.1 hypothetical protein DACRYDRAFT_22593 [Dacryopinax primogenitus]
MHAFIALLLLGCAAPALGWSWEADTYPTQCAPLEINITSPGVPPYDFTFYRLAGYDLPFPQWGNGSVWNFTLPLSDVPGQVLADYILPWAAGSPLLIVGSDATGFASGGTSQVFTIAQSTGNETSCLFGQENNTTYLTTVPAWTEPVTQCGNMTIVLDNVALPVTIEVLVPGGDSFVTSTGNLQYPTTSPGNEGWAVMHTWMMNLTQGTNVAFQVSDANGPIFTSALVSVQNGNDTCLAGYVPPSSGLSGGTNKTGAIVGGVIGGLVGAFAVAAFILFGVHRYNRRKLILRRQTIGLTAYSPTKPERLSRDTWPGRYRDDPEEELTDRAREGPEDKLWEHMDRRMTTTE